jgi:hypothetical protein
MFLIFSLTKSIFFFVFLNFFVCFFPAFCDPSFTIGFTDSSLFLTAFAEKLNDYPSIFSGTYGLISSLGDAGFTISGSGFVTIVGLGSLTS